MSILKIKDSQGNWVGVPTVKGDTGNGISSAILNDDYTLTLTFTDGTTYTTPSIRGEKGEQGEPATDMDIHICSASEYDSETRIPTITSPDDKTFYLVPTEDGTSPDLFTEWVYVDGVWEMFGSASVDLTDYVKNTDIATTTKAGVVKINPTYGVGIFNDTLVINGALANEVKAGNNSTKAVSTYRQHESTFYGLAKASGHDEKDSELPVGQYTDEAKSSIQNMLGITDKYSPKEWVAESETELVTNAHSVGDLFYIGETLYKVIADLNAGDAINVGVNVEEVNANDILDDYATKEDVQDNVSIVEKSASGSVASFNDGMDDMPLKSLTVDINPVQDLHGYDSPWVGGGGKNLLEVSEANIEKPSYYSGTWEGTTIADAKENSITVSRTNGQGGFAGVVIPNGLKAGTYTFSCDVPVTASSKSFYIGYAENGVFAGQKALMGVGASQTHPSKSFTLENDTDSFYIKMAGVTGDVPLTFSHLQIESGNTATAYAPYENICPISGWTGLNLRHTKKNLLPLNIWNGFNYNSPVGTVFAPTLSDKSWTQGENSITYVTTATYTTLSLMTPLLRKGVYYISLHKLSANSLRYSRYVLDKSFTVKQSNYMSNVTDVSVVITLDEDGYIAFRLDNSSTASQTVEVTIQVEVGDTETSYEPYTGTLIPINWQTEAGTVYGGRLDVLSGMMTVTHTYQTFDGDEPWSAYGETAYRFAVQTSNGFPNKAQGSSNIICDGYKVGGYNSNRYASIIGYRTIYSTAQDLKDALAQNPVHVCYELETPIEIQLTPHEVNSILGVNNIFADTGDTEVEYFSQVDKDLMDYIETSLKPYAKEEKLNDYVSDVQINGTSIVENGVVNMPTATTTNFGVMQLGSGLINNSSGVTMVNFASQVGVKTGSSTNTSISPVRQHESVFYGLAKLAGADMSTSSNAIGTYTDEAKTAIKQMLGVHDTIDSFVEEVTGTDVTITGQPSYRYNCGEVLSLSITPPESGTIDIRFTSGSTPTVLTLPLTVKMPEWWVEVEANTIYEMCITDGIYCGVMTWAI